MAPKKSAAKKTTARKPRSARPAPEPLIASVNAIASKVSGLVTEAVMDADDLGVVNSTTKAIGRRNGSGVTTIVKLDDGTRITVTILHIKPKPRKPRTARASRKKASA